jgi:rubrerythrin
MILNTASSVISLARQFETDSATFYEELSRKSEKNEKDSELFLTFAKENKKFITQVERAYYSVITDAIEGCYAFQLETDKYPIDISLPEGTSHSDVLNKAMTIEQTMINFYSDAAEQSKSLMADVPRAFKLVEKKRSSRIPTLKSLL